MNKLNGLLLLGMLASPVLAVNPDGRPSLGLDFTDTYIGEALAKAQLYDSSDNTTTYTVPHSTLRIAQITIDARVPISNSVTFSMHGGPNRSEFFGEKQSGYSVGGGIRYYLPEMK